jgi:hypothetical protein
MIGFDCLRIDENWVEVVAVAHLDLPPVVDKFDWKYSFFDFVELVQVVAGLDLIYLFVFAHLNYRFWSKILKDDL